MKIKLAAVAVAISYFTAYAGTVNPTWNFSDNIGSTAAVSARRVLVTPLYQLGLYNDTNITIGLGTTKQTSTNGSLTLTNLATGYAYRVQIFDNEQKELGRLTNYFGTNISGSVAAQDYITISTNLGSGIYAYSQAAADARFAPIGSGGGSGDSTNALNTNMTNRFATSNAVYLLAISQRVPTNDARYLATLTNASLYVGTNQFALTNAANALLLSQKLGTNVTLITRADAIDALRTNANNFTNANTFTRGLKIASPSIGDTALFTLDTDGNLVIDMANANGGVIVSNSDFWLLDSYNFHGGGYSVTNLQLGNIAPNSGALNYGGGFSNFMDGQTFRLYYNGAARISAGTNGSWNVRDNDGNYRAVVDDVNDTYLRDRTGNEIRVTTNSVTTTASLNVASNITLLGATNISYANSPLANVYYGNSVSIDTSTNTIVSHGTRVAITNTSNADFGWIQDFTAKNSQGIVTRYARSRIGAGNYTNVEVIDSDHSFVPYFLGSHVSNSPSMTAVWLQGCLVTNSGQTFIGSASDSVISIDGKGSYGFSGFLGNSWASTVVSPADNWPFFGQCVAGFVSLPASTYGLTLVNSYAGTVGGYADKLCWVSADNINSQDAIDTFVGIGYLIGITNVAHSFIGIAENSDDYGSKKVTDTEHSFIGLLGQGQKATALTNVFITQGLAYDSSASAASQLTVLLTNVAKGSIVHDSGTASGQLRIEPDGAGKFVVKQYGTNYGTSGVAAFSFGNSNIYLGSAAITSLATSNASSFVATNNARFLATLTNLAGAFTNTLSLTSSVAGSVDTNIFTASAMNAIATTKTTVTNALGTAVENIVFLASSVTNSATNYADVTGLSFTAVSNKHYSVYAQLGLTSAATGSGSAWGLNGGGTPSEFSLKANIPSTATTTSDYLSSGWDLPSARTTGSATAGNVATLIGCFKAATNGTVTVRFASEVGASAIVALPGSMLKWIQTD